MNKTIKFYGILFAVVLLLLALLQLGKKEVTDWRKNFDVAEKSPFGLYIFNQESNKLIGNLQKTTVSPFNYFEDNKEAPVRNYLIVERDVSETAWKKLLNEVTKGSDLLVISTQMNRKIEDSLGFYRDNIFFTGNQTHFFTDRKFKQDSVIIDKVPGEIYFDTVSKETEILAGVKASDIPPAASFIRINFGKGKIYIHSDPIFLTNYYLLKPGYENYAQHVFSYLPQRATVWFMETKDTNSVSPMRFILSNPPLRYAWWLLLAGLLIFVFFNSKRKQRVVPVIPEVKNKSVEFVKTVGNLYLQEGDFQDMMSKKAQYFLNKVRMELLIDTTNLDEEFAKKLQLKTGKKKDEIDEAVQLIKKSQHPYAQVIQQDLMRMNKLLDDILQ